MKTSVTHSGDNVSDTTNSMVICCSLYWFAKAAVTKYDNLGGLTTEMYSLSVLEAGNLRPRCQ